MKIKQILWVLLVLFSENAFALPDAKITVKVVDEAGQPIEGANAGIGFRKPSGQTFGGIIGKGQRGLTDANGLFTAQGATEPFVGIGASKEGYYRSFTKYNFNYNESGMIGFRKWQPWNPTVEVVLKKKIKPIPLYAVKQGIDNEQSLAIPGLNEFFGYDLIARDWVVPYGQGTHKDFLFKLDVSKVDPKKGRYGESFFDVAFTLKFSNPGDGILSVMDKPNDGSELRLPHHAPVSGYQAERVWRYASTNKDNINPFPEDQNYFFRVRTEMDDKGNVTSALYGKIHGNIHFGISKRNAQNELEDHIAFIYYLNPKSNDTNLEYDPEKNLFEGLPPNMGKYGLKP